MDDLFGLLTKTGSNPVPLTGVRVTGDILGRGARAKVAQSFRNGEAQAIEAVYRFPLPETVAVCGFSAIAGGRRIAGDQLKAAWNALVGGWLPVSGYQPDVRPEPISPGAGRSCSPHELTHGAVLMR